MVVRTSMVVVTLATWAAVAAAHPQVLVTSSDREAIRTKLEQAPWAKEAYASLKARVDPYVQRCKTDPKFLSSRLFMNWQTHCITPVVQNSRSIGGEGRAPVPTPRFGGARDWATKYQAPSRLEDLKPYNDNEGKVWLFNKETQKEEWVDPSLTGRMFETVNERIIQTAADAGFLYWLEGDEEYARFASEILCTYMEGFSYMQPPKIVDQNPGLARIIGFDSFEVIHEDIVTPLSVSYDFLYDYLQKQGKDVRLIQTQLKRMADRVIAGGSAEGNWNLNQARIIAYAGLALEDNAQYADGKGHPYYVDVVLNARLPAQAGINHVIKEGYDPATALWAEAPGYSFGTTKDIVLIASLVGADPAGRALLADPMLTRAILAQLELVHPNGFATGLGDTVNPRINTVALELLIAAARQRSDTATETRLTAALEREIASGYYQRASNANLVALTKYVAELKEVPPMTTHGERTFFGAPLNVLMQRNVGDSPEHSLAAAMYGTAGGHVHANGLTMELYGAGLILGADPGRGSSYWQKDHGEYYSQPPAHNTVIVDARSTYSVGREQQIPMRIELLEPAQGQPGVSPNISFVQASFHYGDPAADQQRTLALVRTGSRSGFYFDVFRSRARSGQDSFHDYLYHNIGQSLVLNDDKGSPLPLTATEFLSSKQGCMTGYDYFKDEKSVECDGDINGLFSTQLSDGTQHFMRCWMLGWKGRRVFAVAAPADHAGREALPAAFGEMPMPTLIVRQQGDAWSRPFVAVYEPYLGGDGASIQNVRAARVEGEAEDLVACVVEGRADGPFTAYVVQNPEPSQMHRFEGYDFRGSFGIVMKRANEIAEVYLGSGHRLGNGRVFVAANTDAVISASLRRDGAGWRYSASAPVRVGLEFPVPSGSSTSQWTFVNNGTTGSPSAEQVQLRVETLSSGQKVVAATCVLPAGQDRSLALGTPSAGYDFSPVTAKIQGWVDKGYYPGASLLIAKDNQVVCERYFGNATTDTVVYIASAGKWLAAAAIAAVVDDGKLSWDDPVARWLPEMTDAKGKATLRQLLSHTSGYPDYQPKGAHPDNYQTLTEAVAQIVPLPPSFQPGERFEYGGLAMQVAGRMAELATGKDWETLFQEKIAQPLRMKNTHFTPVDDKQGGHAPMLGGGARSTLHDYGSFLAMIANGGVFEGRRVLSENAIHKMQADQVRGACVEPGKEFVEKARGAKHNGIYGLGEWREELNDQGEAVLISSPSWAGAYPWIDKTCKVWGVFLAHVDVGAAGRDKFNAFYASPVLPMLVRDSVKGEPR